MGAAAALDVIVPSWARATSPGIVPDLRTLSGEDIALTIGQGHVNMRGKPYHSFLVNGGTPAPLIRLKEGQNVRLAVTNMLGEDSSIHWHGLLVPFQMDGVPGISFPGIRPGETFLYEFPIRQYGTYWYHSHSNMQEAMGVYGPIIIDPAGTDPVAYDREHMILLADWSPLHPHKIMQKLKKDSEYFNEQRTTLMSLLDGSDAMNIKDRLEWGKMRMEPTDISDVTAKTYTYLINGLDPDANWTGLFRPGERVRLRIVNGSAMSYFNFRIPGLKMTVVQADGQHVKPVMGIDELQLGVAESYDVIVEPAEDRAYTIVAENTDSSGMARGALAPRPGMIAPVPPLRKRPLLTMRDMGMDMSNMNGPDGTPMQMDMSMRNQKNAPQVKLGAGVASIAPMPVDRLAEPGQGTGTGPDHRVLVYTDLQSLEKNPDRRKPSRSMEIHLTANMERYMWAFDGRKFNEVVDPIPFRLNERVRVKLVNDTMMAHPIHLHGHFFELVADKPGYYPRKHTVNVLPGGTVTFDLTADAEGDWAFHCHLLYHMHSGMFQMVSVRADKAAA